MHAPRHVAPQPICSPLATADDDSAQKYIKQPQYAAAFVVSGSGAFTIEGAFVYAELPDLHTRSNYLPAT
jgi:hypothetical protein